jgi:alkanesulfonate monooxygenase SsuD/methylene tetrahydromethanopterin reductase-like flavin-dependent oxidoreductase (luciferase family)
MTADELTPAPDLRFGIFDWIDANRSLTTTSELYEQRLRMLELADEAGIWCYHLAEHHGTPLGMSPSPNLFLAAAAQRTERLRLGPLVQLLPLYNPVRNIEEVCILDHLTGGRLELGVGRGVSPAELLLYNVKGEESRDIFNEALEVLVQGLSRGRLGYEGHYLHIPEAELPLRPLQQPYPPLWYPSSAPERTEWIASHGFSTFFGYTAAPLAQTAEDVRRYRRVLAEHATDSGRYNAHVSDQRYGVTRHIYVASSDAEALDVARGAYTDFDHNFTDRPFRVPGSVSRRGDFDTALGRGSILIGSPETVRRRVQEVVSTTGINYFVGVFAYGSLTTHQVLSSLGLFTKEVMPAIVPAAAEPASLS